ncbi:MAG: TonB-dependent siderophore receptor [Cyanobacteria bacterium P01_C01_bin.89]
MATWQAKVNLFALLTVIGGQGFWLQCALAAGPNTPEPVPELEIAQGIAEITDIQVQATDTGIEVAIAATGELGEPIQSTTGKALVLEIAGATLSEEFENFAPVEGIALVQVTAQPGNIVRIAITGNDAPPVVNIRGDRADANLVLAVTPSIAQANAEDDAILIEVTGEGDDYVVPNATTATRTDTPLRETPQSIQVIPQQVWQDQGATELSDALRNVSGVAQIGNDPRGQTFAIRGFDGATVLRDGFRTSINTFGGFNDLSNVAQIEVLKGPASILTGAVEPGGAINLVSERPLATPTYELFLRGGGPTLVEPSIDFTGPISSDGRVRYRLNALYRNEEYFRDFDDPIERFFFAPQVSFEISDRTDLLVELEHRRETRPQETGIVAVGDGVADIPFDRVLNYPGAEVETNYTRVGYQFEHRFSDNWRVRNQAYYTRFDAFSLTNSAFAFAGGVFDEETGIFSLVPGTFDQPSNTFEVQTNVVGEFSTGAIKHTLLAGVDFYQQRNLGGDTRAAVAFGAAPFPAPTILDTLDIFDPDYDSLSDFDTDSFNLTTTSTGVTRGWGFYVQDQIEILDNLFVLAGLRFDTVFQELTTDIPFLPALSGESSSTSEDFTPRLGIVYQPSDEISLYASYSRSFVPNTGVTFAGDLLEPEEGEQFEAGIRAELLDGNFVANLAVFDIEKRNIAISDTLNPTFLQAVGSQSSFGVELDIIGEILPGWNVVANYAYIDAEITEGEEGTEGNSAANIPEHSFSVWTTYAIQSGSLEGLSLGLGGNFVGERFGDVNNTFELDSYFLTNAAIAYRRDNWRAAVNFRNLFDVDYIAGTISGNRFAIFPGAGFSVVGSFSITF